MSSRTIMPALTRRGFALGAAGAALAGGHARAADGRTLRVSAYLAPVSHTVVNIVTPWLASMKAAIGDALGFELYLGGSLGRSPYAQFDLLRAGVADIAFAQPSYTSGQFKQLQILEIPFLAHNATEASMLAWRLCERGLVRGFEEVKLLGLWTAEPGYLFTRFPIRGFDDLKNLKLRSAGRLEGEFIESLDARAEAMHPTDVYEAMRRGTIDGTVQGWVAVNTFQTYRVSSHVITAPFGVVSFAMMMNKRTWDGLSPDLQAKIESVSGPRIAEIGGKSYDKRVAEIDAKMRKDKALVFIEPDPADLDRVKAAVKPILARWMERTENGPAVYAAAQEILADLRSGGSGA